MTKQLSSSRARRWTIQGLLAAVSVGLGIAGVVHQMDRGNPVEASQVEAHAEPVDLWVYDRLQNIRQELALTNLDMASLGLGLEASKAVLTGLRGWVEQNQADLEAKDRAQNQARRELHLAQRKVRVGPRDEALIRSLSGLEEALAQATEAKRILHADAGKAIEGLLTASQQSAWQTAKANIAAGVPTRYRYATGMDVNQLATIQDALHKRGVDQSVRYAQADLELFGSQRQAIETAKANQAVSIKAVLLAEDEALPLPMELRPVPDEELLDDSGQDRP